MLLKWKLLFQINYYRILLLLGLKSEEIYYIGGSEALPPPLTREEEQYLLQKLSTGDAAIRAMLIERNLRLVVYIARKFENTGINIEDLVSIGAIGLIKAVNTFDPEKKIKLATYASRCIENEILMYLRKTNKMRQEISLDEVLNVDSEGNEMILADILAANEEEALSVMTKDEDRREIYEALNKLPKREREIIIMRFGLYDRTPLTQKEVADLLGISQSYISRLEKRIIDKMRHEIESKAAI